MIPFTKKQVEVLIDKMSYPISSIAATGFWSIWDYWIENRGNRYWSSASWASYHGESMSRQDREMFRYLTVKGIWKCT